MNTTTRIGYAICASCCTYKTALCALARLREQYSQITPIFSEHAYSTDSRFGKAADIVAQAVEICSREPVHTIAEAEPIGPKGLLDLLIIAPCTGNTLAKIAGGITDSSVTMACKAHLRNGRPVVLAISTNDALSGSARNIGMLLPRQLLYFVPFRQDDPQNKPCSLVADFDLLPQTVEAALDGRQIQPLVLGPAK